MNFREAMDKVSYGEMVRVTPKDESYTYELAVRYCVELDDEILMCRCGFMGGDKSDWEPIAYLFCDEDVIDGEWEIVPDTEVGE